MLELEPSDEAVQEKARLPIREQPVEFYGDKRQTYRWPVAITLELSSGTTISEAQAAEIALRREERGPASGWRPGRAPASLGEMYRAVWV